MRKIFVDCGAWEGLSARFFRENHPDASEFEIYSFECNKELLPKAQKEADHILPYAVWTDDTDLKLYLGHGKYTESSSLFKEKKTGYLDKKNPVIVKGIDFSRWLRESFASEDYIIVKMNIEGAEYPVLKKMAKDGSLDMIDILYVQWHWKKINMPKHKHKKVVRLLDGRVKTCSWNLDHTSAKGIERFRKTFLASIT